MKRMVVPRRLWEAEHDLQAGIQLCEQARRKLSDHSIDAIAADRGQLKTGDNGILRQPGRLSIECCDFDQQINGIGGTRQIARNLRRSNGVRSGCIDLPE